MKSKCCKAPVTMQGEALYEMTRYYECAACTNACDLQPEEPTEHAGRWPEDVSKAMGALVAEGSPPGWMYDILCDHMRQLEAERDELKREEYRWLSKDVVPKLEHLYLQDECVALKAENERLKDVGRNSLDENVELDEKVESLTKECEKLRAREVELIMFAFARLPLIKGKIVTEKHARQIIAEFEESKK